MMKKVVSLFLALVMILCCLSACGSVKLTVEKVQNAGKLVIGTSPDFPPFESLSADGKVEGIEIALRTLNPQVIAFDEIFSSDEADEVIKCFFTGTEVFTTVHLSSVDEITKRSAAMRVLESGAINRLCFISKVGAEPECYSVEFINGKLQLYKEKQALADC